MNSIEDKILIIGASSDLGILFIEKYLSPRTRICAHFHRSSEHLLELKAKFPNQIFTIQKDLTTEDAVINLIQTINESFGVPNKILFLAAGPFDFIRLKEVKWSDFENQLKIQLMTPTIILREFLPGLVKAKVHGKVVFMLSSCTVGVPPPALAHYTSAKYATLGLMKALAAEFAAKSMSINAVSPSMIQTKYLSGISEHYVELAAQQHPKKRIAKPEEIISAIEFLMNEGSNFITGVNLPVSGGESF